MYCNIEPMFAHCLAPNRHETHTETLATSRFYKKLHLKRVDLKGSKIEQLALVRADAERSEKIRPGDLSRDPVSASK